MAVEGKLRTARAWLPKCVKGPLSKSKFSRPTTTWTKATKKNKKKTANRQSEDSEDLDGESPLVGLAVGFIFYLDAALEDEDEVVVGLALLVEQRVGIGTGLIFVAHADHAHHQAVLHQPAQHRLRHPLAAERLVRFRFHNKQKNR